MINKFGFWGSIFLNKNWFNFLKLLIIFKASLAKK